MSDEGTTVVAAATETTKAAATTEGTATTAAVATTTAAGAEAGAGAGTEGTPAAKASAGSEGGTAAYALALPDGSLLDPSTVARVTAFATEHGLTPVAAQAVLATMSGEVGEVFRTVEAANKPGGALYEARQTEWRTQALADPMLGGGNQRMLEEKQLQAQLVVNRLFPELKPLLDESGRGSDPTLLKALVRLAPLLREKSQAVADASPPPVAAPKMRDRYNADGSPKVPATTGPVGGTLTGAAT